MVNQDIKQVIEYIRFLLKKNGMTYKDLGRHLDISEGSVKRIMTQGNFSLERLDEIAKFLGMSLFDLMENARSKTDKMILIPKKEEEYFVKEPMGLHVLIMVYVGHSAQEIAQKSDLSLEQVEIYLKQLDQMGFIDLQSLNKIKIKSRAPFLLEEGTEFFKILKKYQLQEMIRILQNSDKENNQLICRELFLTQDSLEKMRNELDQVFKNYVEVCRKEINSYSADDLSPVGFINYNKVFPLTFRVAKKMEKDKKNVRLPDPNTNSILN